MCLECKEAVHNPLCPKCLAGEMHAWLENKPEKIKQLADLEIKKLLLTAKENPELFNVEFQQCLKCSEKTVSLCPYCFVELVYRKIKKHNVDKEILKEFVQLFNFNFGDTYLHREAEKLESM